MAFSFSKTKLLPLVMKLGDFLKDGFEQYATLKGAGVEPNVDLIAAFILIQMKNWNPKIAGKEVADEETKEACARFLAGIAFNLAK